MKRRCPRAYPNRIGAGALTKKICWRRLGPPAHSLAAAEAATRVALSLSPREPASRANFDARPGIRLMPVSLAANRNSPRGAASGLGKPKPSPGEALRGSRHQRRISAIVLTSTFRLYASASLSGLVLTPSNSPFLTPGFHSIPHGRYLKMRIRFRQLQARNSPQRRCRLTNFFLRFSSKNMKFE